MLTQQEPKPIFNMATLITSIDDIKQYVSINKNVDWESIKPYVVQAERKYIKSLLGTVLYDDYCETLPTANELLAYNLFKEASANLSWFLYLPLASVQVSDSGIAVQQGDNFKAADWWQIRDLRKSFLEAGFNAIDEALKIMEANEADFSPWETTEGYTIFKELFVKRAETFNRWFNINNSSQTFLALRPYLLESHHQYFTANLNAATIATINAAVATTHSQVLELLQAAQVNYAVVKAVNSGAFDLSSNGLQPRLSELPNSKTNTYDENQVQRIKSERLTAAEEYYKKAISIILANPTDFTDYEIKETATFIVPTNTKSIVSF